MKKIMIITTVTLLCNSLMAFQYIGSSDLIGHGCEQIGNYDKDDICYERGDMVERINNWYEDNFYKIKFNR